MSHRLVIFGASGDLTSRKLMPALAQLHEAGQLPPGSPSSASRGTTGARTTSERRSNVTPAMSACSRETRSSLRSSTAVLR